MTSLIPSYSNPCLASTKDKSILYLAGSPNTTASALHVHIINIANISAPVIERSVSSVSSESTSWEDYIAPWKYDAPKKCTTLFGTFPAFYDTLFINQIGVNTTWSTVFHPINGTIPRPTKLNDTAFVSKAAYSFVGQGGDNAWTLALNNRTDTRQPWSFVQWRSGVPSTQTDFSIQYLDNPLLTVGIYTSGPSAPTEGIFIVFDKPRNGVMLPTIINDIKPVGSAGINFLHPQPVFTGDITLTADAIYTYIGTRAYILDKAQDGTISTYHIDSTISDYLYRIEPQPTKVPRFTSGMAAAATGSQIVLYSTTDSEPAQLHFLDTVNRRWSGPDLVSPAPDPISFEPEEPEDQGSTSINLGAIGGAVGGITLLAVTALLLIRRRRRRNSQNNSGNDNSKNSSSNNNITHGKNHASHTIDDNDILPTELDTRSPAGEPLPGKHPQFPAGAPLGYGHAYGYNFGHDIDLAVPLTGPHIIVPNLERYGPPESAPLHGKHPQFPAGAPLGYGHAYRYNFGHDGDLGMPLAGPHVILPNLQRYGNAMYPTQSNTYHDYISPNVDQTRQAFADGDKAEIDSSPSDTVVAASHSFGDKAKTNSSDDFVSPGSSTASPLPPAIPLRPTGYASYSIVHS